jgi:3,4-dihydroxy 2-butanone 4-phosphate synthase/GTP cyclohydrolase II
MFSTQDAEGQDDISGRTAASLSATIGELSSVDPARERAREAIAAIAEGKPVVVVDDDGRENEGDLIFAASRATPQLMAFTVRHTSGFVCVALTGADCDRLALPPMSHHSQDRFGTAYRVPVDLRGTGTGISAAARAATVAALASPESTARDFVRPGHVVPLLARPGGVLHRRGHTEAAVDLTRLAGLPAAGVLCEIVSQDHPGEMARGSELERFAKEHDLVLLSVDDLVRYRRASEPQVRRVVTTSLPTRHGTFNAVGYGSVLDDAEHMALVAGPIDRIPADVPVHVHVECLSGDVLGSRSCACGQALAEAMARFAAMGCGIVVYLRPAGSVRACGLFSDGRADTDAAAAAAEWILADLGAHSLPAVDGPEPARLDEWVAARRRLHDASRRIAG